MRGRVHQKLSIHGIDICFSLQLAIVHSVKDRTVTPRCLGMWRLDSVVKGGRTVQEMVVVIQNICIYLQGAINPNTVPTK